MIPNYPRKEWGKKILAVDYEQCPKCRGGKECFSYQYCAAGEYTGSYPIMRDGEPYAQFYKMLVPEHLQVKCLKCKYEWCIECAS